MEDAAEWGWANSNFAQFLNIFSYGGVVYYKHAADGAPPAVGWTNYWWGYYYYGMGPYFLMAIDYRPDVIPPTKNFGSIQNLCVGNPIHIGIGEKYQIEKDYAGTDSLDFTRYYHSSVFASKGGLGLSWRHAYDRKISMLTSGTFSFAYITRADGKQFSYQLTAGLWVTEGDTADQDTGYNVTTQAESGGKPFGDSIPSGTYDILERQGRPDFYRLDKQDSFPFDDVDSVTGRDHFRLHRPGRTTGCIAAKDAQSWKQVDELIKNTKQTDTVPDNFKPWWKFWPSTQQDLRRYGTLTVH